MVILRAGLDGLQWQGRTPAVLSGPSGWLPDELHPFDVDSDGDHDLLATSGSGYGIAARLLRNDGSGWVEIGSWGNGESIRSVAVGDIDGDGDSDVAMVMRLPPWSLTRGRTAILTNSNGVLSPFLQAMTPSGIPDALVLLDVDGDQDLDLVESYSAPLAGTPPPPMLFLNDGSGGFVPAAPLPAPVTVRMRAGDFNGDLSPDILFDRTVLLNNGTGAFTPLPPVPNLSATYWPPFPIDADDDGDLDLLEDSGFLHRNLGSGVFAPGESLGTITTMPLRAVAAQDFDGDGDDDLLLSGPRLLINVTRQLSRTNVARPGRPVSLRILGQPGAAWFLGASLGLSPVSLPPYGTLLLDLPTILTLGQGLLDTSGATEVLSEVPPNTPINLATYWQALVNEPLGPRLTGGQILIGRHW